MLLFDKRNEKQREQETGPDRDKTARAIARAVCRWQGSAASWLGHRFRALPIHMKQLCLLLFCLLLGGASGWILAQALLPPPKPGPAPVLQHRQLEEGHPDSLISPNHSDSSTP